MSSGSLGLIFEPVGSIIAGLLRETLGYKYSLIAVNVPICIAWALLYNATEIWHVFVGNALLGFTAGLIETPAVTYVGEIRLVKMKYFYGIFMNFSFIWSEPAIRGTLSAFICLATEIGIFTVFFIGSIMEWRQVALFCIIVPITVIIMAFIVSNFSSFRCPCPMSNIRLCILQVPDAPIWLLSKNRPNDAMEALQWLRGWVPPSAVRAEFEQLKKYKESSHACDLCSRQKKLCPHPSPTFAEKISALFRKEALYPLFLVVFMFFIAQFTGLDAMRTYLVQIMVAYGVPLDPKWATTLTEVAGIAGIVILLCTVHHLGKRKIYLTSLVLTIVSCLSLSIYGFINLPMDWNSFEPHPSVVSNNYLPFYVLVGFVLVANLGVIMIPWILMSEVFPLR